VAKIFEVTSKEWSPSSADLRSGGHLTVGRRRAVQGVQKKRKVCPARTKLSFEEGDSRRGDQSFMRESHPGQLKKKRVTR